MYYIENDKVNWIVNKDTPDQTLYINHNNKTTILYTRVYPFPKNIDDLSKFQYDEVKVYFDCFGYYLIKKYKPNIGKIYCRKCQNEKNGIKFVINFVNFYVCDNCFTQTYNSSYMNVNQYFGINGVLERNKMLIYFYRKEVDNFSISNIIYKPWYMINYKDDKCTFCRQSCSKFYINDTCYLCFRRAFDNLYYHGIYQFIIFKNIDLLPELKQIIQKFLFHILDININYKSLNINKNTIPIDKIGDDIIYDGDFAGGDVILYSSEDEDYEGLGTWSDDDL